MKAWKVYLNEGNPLCTRWVVLVSGTLTNDTLVEDIVDTKMVCGTFYRQRGLKGVLLQLADPTFRIIPISEVQQIEEIRNELRFE